MAAQGTTCHSVERHGPGVEDKSVRPFSRDDLCLEPAKTVLKCSLCFDSWVLSFKVERLYICFLTVGNEAQRTSGIPLVFSVPSAALCRRSAILGT